MRREAIGPHIAAGAGCCLGAILLAATGAVSARAVGAEALPALLTAPDGCPGDAFGDAVALGRDWLVVGAPGPDGPGVDPGAAYVFRRAGASWVFDAKLTASDAAAGGHFGHSVAIDGETLVVGAWGDAAFGDESGAAYVFSRQDGTWAEAAKLVASDALPGDSFGAAVALSAGAIAVGAYAADPFGASSGAVYVFQELDGAWDERARLTAADGRAGQYFGCAVSLDGDRLLVGARGDDDAGANAGAAYLFTDTPTGWTEAAKLAPAGAAPGDKFGLTVAASGGVGAVAAPGDDPAGSAFVYTLIGPAPAVPANLRVPGAVEADRFACAVASDGRDVVLGAWGDDQAAADAGAAYVFSGDDGTWRQAAKLLPIGPAAGGRTGWSVAVRDGVVAAGAPGDAGAGDVGAVYVFAAGTRTVWRGRAGDPGDWADANCWSAGVPSGDLAVHVGGASAAVLAGEAAACRLAVGVDEPGELRLIDAVLNVDVLTIGPGGVLRMDGPSCLSVGELVLAPGARIDLGGGELLYANGGASKRLLPGDADLDGDVDADDTVLFEAHFDAPGLLGWLEGDFDADGLVAHGDYLALKRNLSDSIPADGPNLPEPASLLLMLPAFAAALLRRRARAGSGLT